MTRNIRQHLLDRIAEHCLVFGMTEETFGMLVNYDKRFVERLRAGSATLRTLERAEAILNGEGEPAIKRRQRLNNAKQKY